MKADLYNELIGRVVNQATKQRPQIESTYRLQLHKDFNFHDAVQILPYLKKLGITHVYTSPYAKADTGSTHGYNVVDPTRINPELGGDDGHLLFVAELEKIGLSHIVDIVPNHMGVATNENPWWNSILEYGIFSPFALFFDVDWNTSRTVTAWWGQVFLPILEDPVTVLMGKQKFSIEIQNEGFFIRYESRRLRMSLISIAEIFKNVLSSLATSDKDSHALRKELSSSIEKITKVYDVGGLTNLGTAIVDELIEDEIQNQFSSLEEIKKSVVQHLETAAGSLIKERVAFLYNPATESGKKLISEILELQHFQLIWWKDSNKKNNYRRFFNVSELAALKMEREEVFLAYHEMVLTLAARGIIAGVRVDHPDGLYDPKQYCHRLQIFYLLKIAEHIIADDPRFSSVDLDQVKNRLVSEVIQRASQEDLAPFLYVLIEKIYSGDEMLPPQWGVDGTTGYDALTRINRFFVDATGEQKLSETYVRLCPDTANWNEIKYRSKIQVIELFFEVELSTLSSHLKTIAERGANGEKFSETDLKLALKQLIAVFPIYRTYVDQAGVHSFDKKYLNQAITDARLKTGTSRNDSLSDIYSFLENIFKVESPDTQINLLEKQFVRRFQQLTSPVTAKGVEDTAFYQYYRFTSLNEVGGSPDEFGIAAAELHEYFSRIQQTSPFSLTPLSTHDTKRSEDVRARINVISEIPATFFSLIESLNISNQEFVTENHEKIPDPNEQYLMLQSLLGGIDLHDVEPDAICVSQSFIKRLKEYVQKAMREAKVHSAWNEPNPGYEEKVFSYIDFILDINHGFLKKLFESQKPISFYGALNSLAQTVLKIGAPGIPDTYQGTELLDFSFVDPDNRRPVDYAKRNLIIDEPLKWVTTDGLHSGSIKCHVTARCLGARNSHPGLFSGGSYIPLSCDDPVTNPSIFAFARKSGDMWGIVIVGRFFTQHYQEDVFPEPSSLWSGMLNLPNDAPDQWQNEIFGSTVEVEYIEGKKAIPIKLLFKDLPLGLLTSLHHSS